MKVGGVHVLVFVNNQSLSKNIEALTILRLCEGIKETKENNTVATTTYYYVKITHLQVVGNSETVGEGIITSICCNLLDTVKHLHLLTKENTINMTKGLVPNARLTPGW